jgi:serine/threonine-protein kinase
MNMNSLIGQLLSARFRVDDRIGEGATGVVFSATDEVLGRKVAIKVLKPKFAANPRFRERFTREAKIVAQLSLNSHVVTIYDVGETSNGLPFLVSEFLTGHTLNQEFCSPHRPSRSWVLEVGIQIAQALDDAHSRGVVHRDLKPANVFVVRTGVVPLFVKVLDFGLSYSDDLPLSPENATQAGVLQGTPRYMAPESIGGEGSVPASDIYSLGVLLYEFNSGRFPYDAEKPSEFLRAHLSADPLPFPDQTIPMPESFKQLVMQMLSKQPAERPDTRTCVRELSKSSLELKSMPRPNGSIEEG